jgi:hypothetical protein
MLSPECAQLAFMKLKLLSSLVVAIACGAPAWGAALRDAKVSHLVNDVQVADDASRSHPATLQEVVENSAAIATGPLSRVELVFPDRTLTRLGAETLLRFRAGTRDLLLDRGTLLLQVPSFRGGARVALGSLTASLGGATVLVEHLPGASVKLCVLEGDLRVAVNGFLGDSVVLKAGKMLITAPDVRRIPDPVDVDLGILVKTSTLVNSTAFRGEAPAAVGDFPSRQRLERAVAQQTKLFRKKTLFPTNLAIVGSGTSVVIPGCAGGGGSGVESEPAVAEAVLPEPAPTPQESLLASRKAAAPAEEPPLPSP